MCLTKTLTYGRIIIFYHEDEKQAAGQGADDFDIQFMINKGCEGNVTEHQALSKI